MIVSHLVNTNPGLPFSSAVSVGELVFLSGEIGVDNDGTLGADLETQTQRTLENIERTLNRIGLDRTAIVKCTIMLADMREWARFNTVYRAFFAEHSLPARSAFESSKLALGALVEVECIAVHC
jgi:2-iminobutanoate/2-iminopropanoate deaminase